MKKWLRMYLGLLLDQAKLSEGMEITDTVAFAQRLSRITAKSSIKKMIL